MNTALDKHRPAPTTWSQIASNAERQIQRAITNDNISNEQYGATLDAVRGEIAHV